MCPWWIKIVISYKKLILPTQTFELYIVYLDVAQFTVWWCEFDNLDLDVNLEELCVWSVTSHSIQVLQLMPSVRVTSNTKPCFIIRSIVCVGLWSTSLFSSQMTTPINMTKQPVKGERGTRNEREEERLKPVKQHIQGFSFQIREPMRLGQTITMSHSCSSSL